MTLPAALFLLSSSRLRRNFPYLNDNGRKSKFKPLSSEGQIEFQKRDDSIRRQTFELLNARSAAQFERLEQSAAFERLERLEHSYCIEGADYFEGDDPRFSDRRPADKLLNEFSPKPASNSSEIDRSLAAAYTAKIYEKDRSFRGSA